MPNKCELKSLEPGDEDYLSIGRDGLWKRPLPGRIDELRVSDEQVYREDFTPPESFSKYNLATYEPPKLQAGPPLLFAGEKSADKVVPLGSRKYLFIDDALVAESENVTFVVNPPRLAEKVLDKGSTHLVVWDDGEGSIRLYYYVDGHKLAVLTSRDGIHWNAPQLKRTGNGASECRD